MGDILLDDLNDEQRRAVTHGGGPLLIVAGAGTGKTTVITRRIAWLIREGLCKPEEILALTFTDKAAGEMEERVDRLLPYGYVSLWISTFHSFCERILKKHALEIGLPNDFTLLDTTASWLLVRKNLDRFNLATYRPLGNPTKFIHALLTHISRCKDEGIAPQLYLDHARDVQLNADALPGALDEHKKITELAHAYQTYQQLLLENDAFDFGDLILSALRLFEERPALLEHYRKAFPYVLVDEFQDTNIAQYRLIKLISAPRNNMTIVADDDQAIFRWRGASFHNILSFKNDYPESTEIVLTNNYRSPQSILDAAYAFIQQNNPNRLEHRLREQGKELSKNLKSADPQSGIIEHIHCATHDDEVSAVIDKIIELKKSYAEAHQSEGGWGDFAILVRSNDTADPFLEELETRGIPYHFLGAKGLYRKPIVLDIVSFLRVLASPHESASLYRVLVMELWNVSHSSLVEFTHYAHKKGKTLWAALLQIETISEISDADRNAFLSIRGLIEKLASESRQSKATEIFLKAVKETGLLARVSGDADQEDRENLALLNAFFSKVKAFQASDKHARLADFLTFLAYEQESGDEGSLTAAVERDPDAVNILTIHSAKGLEFLYVFLVSVVDRRFPTPERGDAIPLSAGLKADEAVSERAHLEEERRLMYVALTRARRGFFCSSALQYGGSRARKPSQFLFELGLFSSDARSTVNGKAALAVEEPIPYNPKQKTYNLPSSFSFSQLAAFRTCPLQYKFSFLLKIPTFGKPSFSFGKSIHKTLEMFVKVLIERSKKKQGALFGNEDTGYTTDSPVPVTREEFLKLYSDAWIDDWYPSKNIHDEYFEKGKEMLGSFYDDVVAHPISPKTVEQAFTLKAGSAGDVMTVRGCIDRIDSLPDGTVEIIDYKTGKSKAGEKIGFADKEQLLLYQIAAEEVLGEKVSKLTYYYLEDGERVSFQGTDKDTAKVKESMQETIGGIKKSSFEAKPGWHCRYCDFRDICEYRQ